MLIVFKKHESEPSQYFIMIFNARLTDGRLWRTEIKINFKL